MTAILNVFRHGAILIFGVVLLNTLPVWLAEFAALSGLTEVASGLVASLILVTGATACVASTRVVNPVMLRICAAGLLGAFAFMTLVSKLPAWATFAVAFGIGIFLGTLLSQSLADLSEIEDPVPAVGQAVGLGLILSLALLILSEVMNIRVLPLITASATVAVIFTSPRLENAQANQVSLAIGEMHLVPFFLAMGAYWVFLELYAQSLHISSVVSWIAGSLAVSAAGSWFSARVASHRRMIFQRAALALAALTAALTYVSESELMIGFMILANAFFLFLFFPLYLAAPSPQGRYAAMVLRMSTYLIGFAFGGAAGTAMLSLGGYPLLAAAIGITALGAFRRLQ